MKKLFYTIVIILCLFICGCEQKPNNYIEFVEDEIIIELYGIEKADYLMYGQVSNIKFEIEDTSIAVYSSGSVISRKPGETYLHCTYNDGQKVSLKIIVLDPIEEANKLELADATKNQEVYENLMLEIGEYETLFTESEYLTFQININYNGTSSVQTIKAVNDPIFLEINSSGMTVSYKEENEKIIQYTKGNNSNIVSRNYLCTKNEFLESSNDLTEGIEPETSFVIVFDPTKSNAEYSDGKYTIKGYFKDLLGEDSKGIIGDLYDSLGTLKENIFNSVVTLEYTINDTKLTCRASLLTNVEINGNKEKLDLKMAYEIDIKEFTPTDYLNGEYTIMKPNSFEDVFEITDIENTQYFNGYEEMYLCSRLEKGILNFDDAELSGNQLTVKIYNENYELVSTKSLLNDNILSKRIVIPESGMYYIYLKNNYSSNCSVTFYNSKCDEVTMIDDAPYLEEGVTYTGSIENMYDFDCYKFDNSLNEEKSLKINNTGDSPIYFYFAPNRFNDDYELLCVEAGKSIYIPLRYQLNHIFILNEQTLEAEKYNYSFDFTIFDLYFDGRVIDGSVDETYNFAGFEVKYVYMYLEKGHYLGTEDSSWTNEYFSLIKMKLYDSDGNIVNHAFYEYYGYEDELENILVVPEDGYYYVRFGNSTSGKNTKTLIKLDYNTLAYPNNPLTMEQNNTGFIEGTWDFEYYKLSNTTGDKKIYKITNNSDSNLNITYSEYGSSLTLQIIESGKSEYFLCENDMYFLVCGDYYIVGERSYNYDFSIDEIINENGVDSTWENLDWITTEYSEKVYMAGYTLPDRYMRIKIEEYGVLEFQTENDNIAFYVRDLNGNTINYNYEIYPGEYLVVLTNNDHIFGMSRVKYTFKSAEDTDVDVELKMVDLSDYLYGSNFSGIINLKVTTAQQLKYHFTLDSKSSVIYRENDVVIYNSKGENVTIYIMDYYYSDYGIVELEAGSYYCMTPYMYGGSDSYVQIGLCEVERDSYQDLNNMLMAESGEILTFTFDWKYDHEYYAFELTEAHQVMVSASEDAKVFLFDSEFKYIYDYMDKYELDSGIYYVVIAYQNINSKGCTSIFTIIE